MSRCVVHRPCSAHVRVGEHGTDIVWSDEIDMAADTLWRLAQEQAGITMSPDAFKHWRERQAFTLDTAARGAGHQPPHGRLLRTGHEAYSPCRRAGDARLLKLCESDEATQK